MAAAVAERGILRGMSVSRIERSTAVVVLNHDGRRHLRPCLTALAAMDGLAAPDAIVVADNASADGSRDLVRSEFPGVRVIELPGNLGFAAGNNEAAHAIDADYVLFLNNDTVVAADVLVRLAAEIDRGAGCAGARLVDWDERRLDFDGGGAAFTGHGHPLGHGRAVPRVPRPAHPTLFSSGAAMLVDQRAFLDLGGFDRDYFAYYEDVDLGWRLRLAGLRVMHVPDAVVRHRGGGSSRALAPGRAALLLERNALANVVKWFDEARLRFLLPAALSLAAVRAGADETVIDAADPRSRYGLPLPDESWVGWAALAPLALDWPALSCARSAAQSARRVPDVAVLPHLVDPLAPVPPTRTMRSAVHRAVDRFQIGAVLCLGDRGVAPVPGSAADRYAAGATGGPRTRRAAAWRGAPTREVVRRIVAGLGRGATTVADEEP